MRTTARVTKIRLSDGDATLLDLPSAVVTGLDVNPKDGSISVEAIDVVGPVIGGRRDKEGALSAVGFRLRPLAAPAKSVAAAPADARVYFVGLQDRSVVAQKATLRFGLVNMGVAPAGIEKPNTGHHHLLIDAKLPPLDEPIPNDFNHLHFGAGQTEATVNLPLGVHTLQLLLGDENHVPHNPPVMSKPIKVIVTRTVRRPGG